MNQAQIPIRRIEREKTKNGSIPVFTSIKMPIHGHQDPKKG